MRYSKAALVLMARGIYSHMLADELGVRPQSVSRWLAGQTPARPELYEAIAAYSDQDFAQEVCRLVKQARE